MSTTVIVVLGVSFLFGAMVLMLAMGYQETEQKRALQAKARQAEAVEQAATLVAVPGFFAQPNATPAPTFVVFDDAMVHRLERHVRTEQELVAQFVHHPSIDNLYRHPATELHVH